MAIEKPNLSNNFTLRGESFKEGVFLLLRHLTEQDWRLGNKFSARSNLISKKIETLSTVENDHDSREIKISLSKKSIKPLHTQKLLFSEYSTDTCWFNSLTGWQKSIIGEITEKLLDVNQEESIVHSILSSLRNMPGLANASFHEIKIDYKQALSYFRHATQLPIDLLGKRDAEDEQLRLTCLNLASQIKESIERKIQRGPGSTPEISILMQSLVSPGKLANLKAKFFSVASDNDTQIYLFKEKAIQLFQQASANPKMKIEDDKIKKIFFDKAQCEKDIFYNDLLEKWGLSIQGNIFQDKLKLTLLSINHPLNTLRYFEAYQPQIKGNEKNTALLLGVVARYDTDDRWNQFVDSLNKYNTVDELNIKLAKRIKTLELCEKEKIISSNNKQLIIRLIKGLLASEGNIYLDEKTIKLMLALNALLSIPRGQGVLTNDKRHKSQQKSTVEVMVVNCLKDTVWMACKSGKDRTGGASIVADATYYEQRQCKKFPLYHDNELKRKDYLKISQKLYKLGHHQNIASKNAPGAKSLIKSTSFFPGDLKLEASQVLLETELARLNKPKVIFHPKKKKLDYRTLKLDFQEIKDKTNMLELGTNTTFVDWQRNWESYSINGKSVKELRENKKFKNERDLSTFIDIYLLTQVQDQQLKEYYKTLVLYSFHQGGFPHAFSKVSMESVNKYLAEKNAIIGQPDVQINFSWSEDLKGIQIEELNTYKEKKDMNTGDVLLPEKGEYYCQTQSCVLLKFNEAKGGTYQLAVNIQSANIDCVDELRFLFFKNSNLLETFILYLQSIVATVKHYFNGLIKKPGPVNNSWLSKANQSFFQHSINSRDVENEDQDQLQNGILASLNNQ